MSSLQEILPIDGYHVTCFEPIADDYEISLTHLYQPLIGFEAVALYKTLIHEYKFFKQEKTQTHHTLMSYLNTSLDVIYEARQKLEAIGLLQTFQTTSDHYRLFTYSLVSPFSPTEFFKDVMLQQLLYHHIGKERFERLKERFQVQVKEQIGQDITANFYDVFEPFTPTYNPTLPTKQTEIKRGLRIEFEQIDDQYLSEALSRRMIHPEKILTYETKKIIAQMMTLYGLQTFEIEHALQWAIDEEQCFQQDRFIEACEDLFARQTNQRNAILQATNRPTVKQEEQRKQEKQKTKVDVLLQKFKTMSPREILEDFSSNNEASKYELRMIGEIMREQDLKTEVMNVLLHYILLQTGHEISRAYLESIASSWSRAKLTTAEEAMEFARNRQKKLIQKQERKNTPYPRNVKREVIPKWVEQKRNQKDEKQVPDADKNKSVSEEQKRKQIADALSQFINE